MTLFLWGVFTYAVCHWFENARHGNGGSIVDAAIIVCAVYFIIKL